MKQKSFYLFFIHLLLTHCFPHNNFRSAKFEFMSEKNVIAIKLIAESVYVDFTEGADKDFLVTNIEITRAIRTSLIEGKFFNKLSKIPGENFVIKAFVRNIDENHRSNEDFNIRIDMKYLVYYKKELLKEFYISMSSEEAFISEGYVGIRSESLYEITIKNNIRKFLMELNKMNLSQVYY
jgi:hypothetical protein